MNNTKNHNLICLKADKIAKSYEGKDIIRNISLELKYGELVCLLGISGIGKTTLFNILSGLERPDSGQVWLLGKDVTGKSGQVSYMQQKDLLLPFKTILANLCVPLRLKGIDKKTAEAKVLPLLAEFGLEGAEQKYPSQLSGGMRQRAALLRAYLFSGEVMLLDEPFSALDAITKGEMHSWFKRIVQTHNTTGLFITHDLDEAILLSDRIYIMSGDPGEITAQMAVEYHGERDYEFTLSPEFMAYKKQVLSLLK